MKVKYLERTSSLNTSRWIWRYMNTAKFLSMLHTSTLFFSPASKQTDRYEGKYRSLVREDLLDTETRKNPRGIEYISNSHHRNFLSCWFKSEIESLGMWNLYGGGPDCIAIQSDLDWFKKGVTDHRDIDITVGPVNYIPLTKASSYNIYAQPNDDDLFWDKDDSYSYEKEWRFIISLSEDDFTKNADKYSNGISVNIDLDKIIQRVYLSPYMPSYYKDLWESIIRMYHLNAEVRMSRFSSQS